MNQIRLHWLAVSVLVCLASDLPARQPEASVSLKSKSASQSAVTASTDSPTEDLVFLGAENPVFVRLFAYVDGREIRAARGERIAKALSELDDNRDGAVDQAERDAHPRAFRSLGIPEKWVNLMPLVDRAPKDTRITSEEISLFVIDRFGPAVTLMGRIRRGNQAVELFDLLDADGDQRLTEPELSSLPTRLNKLDSDGDDAFSIVEVEPFRNPFGNAPSTTAAQEDLPWAIAKSSSQRLLARFDLPPKDNALSAAELGQTDATISPADADRNGKLSIEELQKWLLTVTPQYVLTTNSFKRKAGRTELSWEEVTANEPAADKSERVVSKSQGLKKQAAKSLEVTLSGLPFKLEMTTAGRGLETVTVTFYRNQFRRADADKNKYLDKIEFNMFAALGAAFEMVDADDNGQIYEPELVDYLSLESASEQSQVILSFDRNEQSLFSLLDRNSDRRLTAREATGTFDRWQAYDHDGDHVLNRSELSGRMRMVVELPKPKLLQDNFIQRGEMSREPVIPTQADGPVWFLGMDRNKDGDVSRREFLGTDAQFQKWDRDADGLISKTEAM